MKGGEVTALLLLSLSFLSFVYAQNKPNIIFILTDDQDVMLGSLKYQPKLQQYIAAQGAFLPNYFVTTPLCCPSRASILRGQYAHNTNITSLVAPGGGAQKFRDNGAENSTMGSWLHDAGYKTALIGKYLNEYKCTSELARSPPAYWDYWFVLCDPFVYHYYNSTYSVNGNITKYENEYQTETIGAEAINFIENNTDVPFFLYLSGVAPHDPATPAKQYAGLFDDVRAPQTPSYNHSGVGKPSFLADLPPLTKKDGMKINELYRNRLRTLQSVDDNIEAIVTKLDELGILNNTYIIYTADNGFHMGQYRLEPGKREPYETDVRVPFFIRGPGIDANITVDINANNIDIAPTIADIAGVQAPDFVDGKSIMPFVIANKDPETFRPEVLLEHWGLASHSEPKSNDTWQGLRILNSTMNTLYTSWCTSQNEYYGIADDPYELYNRFNAGLPDVNILDSTLRALFQCANGTCQSLSVTVAPYSNKPLTVCYNGD